MTKFLKSLSLISLTLAAPAAMALPEPSHVNHVFNHAVSRAEHSATGARKVHLAQHKAAEKKAAAHYKARHCHTIMVRRKPQLRCR